MTQPWPLAITRTLIPRFANPRVFRPAYAFRPSRARSSPFRLARRRAVSSGGIRTGKIPGIFRGGPETRPRSLAVYALLRSSPARGPSNRKLPGPATQPPVPLPSSLPPPPPLAKRRRKERTNRFYPTHLIGAEERIPGSRDGVSSRVSFLRNNAPVTPKPVIAPNSYRPHGCRRVGVTLFLRSASAIWRSRARSRETSHGSCQRESSREKIPRRCHVLAGNDRASSTWIRQPQRLTWSARGRVTAAPCPARLAACRELSIVSTTVAPPALALSGDMPISLAFALRPTS